VSVPKVTQPVAPAQATQRTGLVGTFGIIESRQPEPMLPLSIFRVPTMTASLLASLFQGLASFAVLFLVIMYLQGPRGLSPIRASLLLVPGYVLGSVAGPYAGRLADRRGPVLPATAGLAIQVVSLAIYAQLSNTTGPPCTARWPTRSPPACTPRSTPRWASWCWPPPCPPCGRARSGHKGEPCLTG
jgi:hypothetical protein